LLQNYAEEKEFAFSAGALRAAAGQLSAMPKASSWVKQLLHVYRDMHALLAS
jgi:hypothetical protein